MDESLLKAQLKLSLEILSNTLNFLVSPSMAETLKRFCLERDFYETARRVVNSVRALESNCLGARREDIVRRLLTELRRCDDLGCVRALVEEYERILGQS